MTVTTVRRILAGLTLALLAALAAAPVEAAREAVSLALSRPLIPAGGSQTVYLKVGLEVAADAGFRAPVNVAVVIDRSGSMQGEKLARAKEAAAVAVSRLRPDDIVSVIAYDDTVRVLLPATRVADRRAVLAAIEALEAGGSTALFAGVSHGAAEVRKFLDLERVNRVVLLSDGLANVGPDSPAELGALGASLKKEGIAVSTIGLGLGYNEDLMARLAGRSDGNHAFVEHPRDLARIFDLEFGDALSVTAQDVLVEIVCAPGTRPVRVLGRDAEIAGRTVAVALNQLYDAHEQYILLELEAAPGRAGESRTLAEVRWSYLRLGETPAPEAGSRVVAAGYSADPEAVAAREDPEVMVAVVEQVATERNRLALDLRDEGRIAEAQSLLLANTAFAQQAAEKYDSQVLADVAAENEADAETIVKQEEWQQQRKSMKENQLKRSKQRKW
ncbi:MAG TPA: VWA domain-containing protein [Candidatus Sulfomarinibacteraceae bacterium]|nr:VWA domain-containing protein [Candidatus Sulfomarinibacteraceae bacterium]